MELFIDPIHIELGLWQYHAVLLNLCGVFPDFLKLSSEIVHDTSILFIRNRTLIDDPVNISYNVISHEV